MNNQTSQKNNKTENRDLLDRMDLFFEKHERAFLWISLVLGALLSIFMFDCKVSLSGDDCDYIINAQNFIIHFIYPAGRGSLYPIAISPFLLGGLNLLLLKSLSAVFILLSMWLMYKSFRGKVPASVLMPTLLITNICSYIYFYASYTYSEPFFMLVQSLFIFLFSKYFWNGKQGSSLPIQTNWKKFAFIGLCFLAMGLTRTIGYAVMGAVILYFCFQKQWKNLLYSFSASAIMFALFSILKKIIWPESGAAYNINNYLAKNFYGIEQGMEDIPGFINRLVVNSNMYLSGFFYQFLGIRPLSEVAPKEIPMLSIFTYTLFIVCAIILYKKNKPLFFTGLYAGTMNFASFILLQTVWAQDRLIMIYYPLMLLFLLGGIYYFLKNKILNKLTWLYPIILICLFIGTSIHSKAKIEQNIPVLQQNILGNDLYGLTPDWENFIKMSRWTKDNLDKNTVIASRKPSISYIYTGRKFYGIYNVPYVNIHNIAELYSKEKENNVFLTIAMNENASALIASLGSHLQYVFVSKKEGNFFINNQQIQSAIVYKIEKTLINDDFMNYLDTNNINYTLDYNTFLKQFIEDNQIRYQIVNPDILLKEITENNIRYLILAKIRIYTPQNTGMYINTIHQYINFINLKYPNRFKLIHTIGKEETCELVEFTGE